MFNDATHPTQSTHLSKGCVRKGTIKTVVTIASKHRENIIGSLNLATQCLTTSFHETVDANEFVTYLRILREKYSDAENLYVILDNGPYAKSKETQESAEKLGIILK